MMSKVSSNQLNRTYLDNFPGEHMPSNIVEDIILRRLRLEDLLKLVALSLIGGA